MSIPHLYLLLAPVNCGFCGRKASFKKLELTVEPVCRVHVDSQMGKLTAWSVFWQWLLIGRRRSAELSIAGFVPSIE